jgi:rod shape-determining protein MreC
VSSVLATRATRRRGLAFLVLLLISVMLMAFSSNPIVREVQSAIGFAFRPMEGAMDGVAAAVASVAGGLGEIDRLRVDNATLKADNDRLTTENARLDEIRRENEQLSALLQFRAAMDFKTTAATVIARESSEFRRLIVLDRGTNDGVAVGDVAVAAGGALVGRVTEAGPDSSKVVLLTDTGSTVIGQLTTNAATGDVVGQLGGVLIMKQIDASKPVATGDEVVTAGIELSDGIRSAYPKGLLIGKVIDTRRDTNDVVQTAFLQPAASMDSLEFVLVITDYHGGLAPTDGSGAGCAQPASASATGACMSRSPSPTASGRPTPRASAKASARP